MLIAKDSSGFSTLGQEFYLGPVVIFLFAPNIAKMHHDKVYSLITNFVSVNNLPDLALLTLIFFLVKVINEIL